MDNTEIYIVKINNIKSRVICEDVGVMEGLYKEFNTPIHNFWFNPKVKKGIWDGKISFVHRDGTFDNGLFNYVYDFLKRQNGCSIIADPLLLPGSQNDLNILKEKFLQNTEKLKCQFAPYAHQLKGAIKCIFYKRAILEHCTSAGKSLTQALIINHFLYEEPELNYIVIVPRIDLVDQLSEDYKSYGIDPDIIGKFYGAEKTIDKKIVISTWQSLLKNKSLLRRFSVLIVDECHGLKSTEVRSVSEAATKCKYRFGVTGTLPDVDKGYKSEKLLIEGIVGPVVDVVKPEELQKLKIISDIKIDIPFLSYPDEELQRIKKAYKTLNDKEAYVYEKEYIIKHSRRNLLIKEICDKFLKNNQNVLILATRIEHTKELKQLFESHGIDPYIVTGKTKITDRNFVRNDMEKQEGKIIIASTGVYSTGISIKRLHGIIFANAGKSKIETLQSVGRGLRLHATKDKLHLYDISDNLKYSSRHLKERMEYYAKNNFEVEIKEINI